MRNLDVWYSRLDMEQLVRDLSARATPEQRKRMEKNLEKSRTKDSLKAFAKLTEVVDGELRIVNDPPLIVRLDELAGDQAAAAHDRMRVLIRQYRRTLSGDRRKLIERFRYVDAARKVVGVGSVGTRCMIALFMAADDDPLFLQIKEAKASVLEPYAGKSAHSNHGERVVVGQRLMQSASDFFLGWAKGVRGGDFYVRQLRDTKISPLIEDWDVDILRSYGRFCGWALARAHARSGDAARIAGYMGSSESFDDAISEFAMEYADQNQSDYRAFVKAVRQGRIQAVVES
jgi:uncharacterized protein (DUF2252 family)